MVIEISINAGADTSTSSVIPSGSVSHVITDKEIESFALKDDAIRIGITKACNQKFGTNGTGKFHYKKLLFRSPQNVTTYDPYYINKWPEVTVVLAVQSATIMGITSEPEIVAKQIFINNFNQKADFDAHISSQVTNTTESTWSISNTIQVQQMIKYNIKFLGAGGGGETTLGYSHSWGNGGSESKQITLGSTAGVVVPLNPKESVEAVLSASRGIMKVRIVYGACLSGFLAVVPDLFIVGENSFIPLDIDSVMKLAGLLNNITVTEDIEIGFYANSKIDIKNA